MKHKKIFKNLLAGVLVAATALLPMTSVNAASETKSLTMYRFDTDILVWQTAEEVEIEGQRGHLLIEPNYFRGAGGEVAYCVNYDKDAPTDVTKSDDLVPLAAYNVVKAGYPSISGSNFGISDTELEWATTFAVKAVTGGNKDFSAMEPVYGKDEKAAVLKGVVESLIQSGNSGVDYDRFEVKSDSVQIKLENDVYTVGPYTVNTNLDGTISATLQGAPSDAKIVENGGSYYVTIPDNNITSVLNFSIEFRHSAKMLSANIYKPASDKEQNMLVYELKDAVASVDIKLTPEKRGIIVINKQNENGDAIKGVEFTIYDSNGAEVEKIVTDSNGKAMSSKLPLGKYTVKETKAADGYIISDEVYIFDIVSQNNIYTTEVSKTIINKRNVIELIKVAAGTDNGLRDAEFEIYNSEKELVTKVTSDKDGKITIKGLPAGTYTVKEVKAPAGYVRSKDVFTFAVDENGKVSGDVRIENTMIKIEVKKVDANTGATLAGATLEVRNANNEIVASGKTNSKGILTIEKLPAGSYTLIETAPPAGYQINTQVLKFTVDEYGVVTGDTVMKDSPTVVTIYKKDAADNKVLAGAKITIKDSNGKVVATGTTNDKGIFSVSNLAPGVYVFYEDEAPEGYIKTNEKSTFTINAKGENVELTLYNEKFTISSSSSSNSSDSTNEIIKTGVIETVKNNAHIFLIIAALILGAGSGIALYFYKKKKE